MKPTYNLKKAMATPNLGSLIGSLKDQVSIMEVVDALDLRKKFNMQQTGNSLQGDCVTGHASTGHRCFSIDTEQQLFHCFSCGESGDIVNLTMLVNNVGLLESVRWLCDKFAPTLSPSLDQTIENMPPEKKEQFQRAVLYSLLFEHGKELLYQPQGKQALDYLVQTRGYDSAKLPSTEWIYWAAECDIRAHLMTVVPAMKEQVKQLPLTGAFGDNFRLALPYRDRHGMITGFVKRHDTKTGYPDGNEFRRWDSTPGLKKTDLYGLSRIKNMPEVLLVEGFPDCAYLPQLGVTNIIALGSATFSSTFLEGLVAKDVKRIILGLDNDGGTGTANSEKIARSFAGSDIDVFIIDPPAMGAHKDPDEFVAANGIDAFRKLMEGAESASTWITKRILAVHDTTTDTGRAAAIDETFEYATSLKNPLECQAVVDIVRNKFNLTAELLELRFEQYEENAAEERLRSGINEIVRDAQTMAKLGSVVDSAKLLMTEPNKLLAEYTRAGTEPEEPLSVFLNAKQLRDGNRVSGHLLGYKLKQFPALESAMCGLQPSMTVVAGDPNTGKTILTVNLTVDILNSNDAAVVFYSMDDTRDAIVSRLIARLSELPINDVQRKVTDPAKAKLVEDAYAWLESMASAGRLNVQEITDSLTMGRIKEDVRSHPLRHKLVVIVDGLYNVPMDESYSSLREENINRANQVKEMVKLFKVPLIVTAELRKRTAEDVRRKERTIHDVMETGKFAYNADVLWLLTPQNADNYRAEAEPVVDLEFAKNKLSDFRGTVPLKFMKATAKFTEAGTTNPFDFTKGV